MGFVERLQLSNGVSRHSWRTNINPADLQLMRRDFKADLDVRKVRYQSGFGESARLHRGFFDAVLECFDEVVERLRSLNTDPYVPVYVTGHSLGGAMAAIFHAKLEENDFHPFGHRRRHRIPRAIACYTFGMPRYGDTSAKAFLPQPFHTFNELDAIPTLPPRLLGYADSANERCLNAIPDVAVIHSKGDFAMRSPESVFSSARTRSASSSA